MGYGPQESAPNEKQDNFWQYRDEKVREANKDGSGLVIQFDGNLWAGKKLLPGNIPAVPTWPTGY